MINRKSPAPFGFFMAAAGFGVALWYGWDLLRGWTGATENWVGVATGLAIGVFGVAQMLLSKR